MEQIADQTKDHQTIPNQATNLSEAKVVFETPKQDVCCEKKIFPRYSL